MPISRIGTDGIEAGAPYWDASGNVGLGTSSPFNRLTVVEPSTSSGVAFIGNQVNTSSARPHMNPKDKQD